MKRTFIVSAVSVAAIALAVGMYAGKRAASTPDVAPQAVQALFDLSLNDGKGSAQALSQWKNHFLIVNFWATWCTPCVQEMPELSALQQELSGKRIQIIGLGIDSPSNISEFLKQHPVSYPVYMAGLPGTELSQRLGNQASGLPFTVLVTANGKIAKQYLGRLKMDELRADIAKFSAEK